MKTRPCNPDMSVYKGIKWTLALDVSMLPSFFLTWTSSERSMLKETVSKSCPSGTCQAAPGFRYPFPGQEINISDVAKRGVRPDISLYLKEEKKFIQSPQWQFVNSKPFFLDSLKLSNAFAAVTMVWSLPSQCCVPSGSCFACPFPLLTGSWDETILYSLVQKKCIRGCLWVPSRKHL